MAGTDKRRRQKENTRAAREAREAARRRDQRRKNVVRVGAALLVVALAIGVGAILTNDDDDGEEAAATTTTAPVETTTTVALSEPDFQVDPNVEYSAKITTNFGEIVLALDTENAPVGAGHFIKLAKDGFYDGLKWHRAVPDFVIQGGDPNGDGTGGTGSPPLVAETPQDNYPEGALAAAKAPTDPPGSFDSQFFIVTGPNGGTLPNEYARFGMVTSGLDVAQSIEALAPGGDGPPTQEATIDKIEIIETPRPTDTTAAVETTTTGQP